MRVTPILAVLLTTTLILGCDQDRPTSVLESVVPRLDANGGESWTITTYYWENNDWVRQSALNGSFLPADLRIGINAHNWGSEFPGFWAEFDNVRAFGDIDLPQGVIDDFDNGLIGLIWDEGGVQCAWWRASACVDPARGVLVADIPQGSDDGLFRMVGLNGTDLVVHGEFDVQVDFNLDPAFHSAPTGKTNIMLCLWDEFWVNAICNELDSGFYATWRGLDGSVPVPQGYIAGMTLTDDLQGKLRITRTRVHKGGVVESVTGSGHLTAALGDWRTFSFTARRYADGTVKGQWERARRQDGNAADSKSHGVVTCFTVVGDQAWIGGYATSGLHSDPPNAVAWRVVDNSREESTGPDQISGQYWRAGRSYPASYCANTPEDPALTDIEAGSIQIRQ